MEPRRAGERELLAVVERLTSEGEDLPAESRIVDDDGRVVELEMLHQGVERSIDEGDSGAVGRKLRHDGDASCSNRSGPDEREVAVLLVGRRRR